MLLVGVIEDGENRRKAITSKKRNNLLTFDDEKGKQVIFVTNNSTKARKDYKKKFDGLGIPCSEVRYEAI